MSVYIIIPEKNPANSIVIKLCWQCNVM